MNKIIISYLFSLVFISSSLAQTIPTVLYNNQTDSYHFGRYGKIKDSTIFYDYAEPFSEGKALVVMDKNWFFIDSNFKPLFNKIFSEAKSFVNGFAIVLTNDGQSNLIDSFGNFIFQQPMDDVQAMQDNMCAFSLRGKWGFANANGIKIPPKYDEVLGFQSGMSWVKIDHKWHLIDNNGNYLTEHTFNFVSNIHNKTSFVWYLNRLYRLDANFELKHLDMTIEGEILQMYQGPEFMFVQTSVGLYWLDNNNQFFFIPSDWVKTNGNSMFAIQREGYYRLYDLNLKLLNRESYEDLDFLNNRWIKVYKGKKSYFMDADLNPYIKN
jgi:hypothetical protein